MKSTNLWFLAIAATVCFSTAEITLIKRSATSLEWNLGSVLTAGKRFSVEVLLNEPNGNVRVIDEPLSPGKRTYSATNLKSNKRYQVRVYPRGQKGKGGETISEPAYTNLRCYSCHAALSVDFCTKVIECAPSARECYTRIRYFSGNSRFGIYKGCKTSADVWAPNHERLALAQAANAEVKDLTTEQALETMPGLIFFGDIEKLLRGSVAIRKQVKKKFAEKRKLDLENALKKKCSTREDPENFCRCCCSEERCNHAMLDCGTTEAPDFSDEPLPPDIATTRAPRTFPTRPPRKIAPVCRDFNGGCDHICIPLNKTTARCECYENYKLQKDGKTCMTHLKHAVADAGPDITITLPQNSVTLTANRTKGSVRRYKWWDPIATGTIPGLLLSDTTQRELHVTNLKEGQYKFVLMVTGMDGRRTSDVMTLIVKGNPAAADGTEAPTQRPKRPRPKVLSYNRYRSHRHRKRWKQHVKESGLKTTPPTPSRPLLRFSTTPRTFTIIKRPVPRRPATTTTTTAATTEAPTTARTREGRGRITTILSTRETKPTAPTARTRGVRPGKPRLRGTTSTRGPRGRGTNPRGGGNIRRGGRTQPTRGVRGRGTAGGRGRGTPSTRLRTSGRGRVRGTPSTRLRAAGRGRGRGTPSTRLRTAGRGRGRGTPATRLRTAGRGRGRGTPTTRLRTAGRGRGKGTPTTRLRTAGRGRGRGSPPTRLRTAGRGRGRGSPPTRLRTAGGRTRGARRRGQGPTRRSPAAAKPSPTPTVESKRVPIQKTQKTVATPRPTSARTPTTTARPTRSTTTTEQSVECPDFSPLEQRHVLATCSNSNVAGSECQFQCQGQKILKGGSASVTCGLFEATPRWMNGQSPAVLPCCEVGCPGNAFADVIFLIHSATKTGRADWTRVLNFVNSMVSEYTFGSENVCVGAVRYHRIADVKNEVALDCSRSKAAFRRLLLKMPFAGIGSNTAAGLTHLRTKSLKIANNRPNAKDVAVVITDTRSVGDVTRAAKALKASDVKVHVIGLKTRGGTPVLTQMRSMASFPAKVANIPRIPQSIPPAVKTQFRSLLCAKGCERFSSNDDHVRVAKPKGLRR